MGGGETNMSKIVITSVAEYQARLQELESDEVVPHSSGYVEGIDPEKLKEVLCDLDDDRFIEKTYQSRDRPPGTLSAES